jgi:hypothetical protein
MKPTSAKLLHTYQNGNVTVTLYEDGTKVREWPDGESPRVTHPESCDLKITQYCDLDSICVYCHEMSNKQGKHGDLDLVAKIWETQYPGTELAIGGGNPLAHPGIESFLRTVTSRGIIPNVTMNMLHMKKFGPTIKRFQEDRLLYGLGISYRGGDGFKFLPDDIDYSNVVFHMILGVHSLGDCMQVIKWCRARDIKPKILLLGYKTYGKGKDYYNPELQKELDRWKGFSLQRLFLFEGVTISFDNLAITQLDLQKQVPREDWELLYQGEDGSHTFYVDAVKGEVARTSTSDLRYAITDADTVVDIFNKVKEEHAYA